MNTPGVQTNQGLRQLRISEITMRVIALLLIVGIPLGLLALRKFGPARDVVEIHARMPEQGGWSPADLTVVAGEPLRLRLVSDDVLHSFAIGQSEQPSIDLKPGHPIETTLTFDQPGKYTYYCTRWCGRDHWRMRGTIEVLPRAGDEQAQAPGKVEPPLYVSLGLDLDAPHPAALTPPSRPSTAEGETLKEAIPPGFLEQDFYRTHSPAESWQALRDEPALQSLSDGQVWDLIAYLWKENTSPERLEQAARLYAQNCAACHGEQGAGDGVLAAVAPADGQASSAHSSQDSAPADGHAAVIDGHALQAPADFTDAKTLLGASPALLHGKIVRGGMGTGMPYWGPIFRDDQIWMLVEYLYTFQFDHEMEEK